MQYIHTGLQINKFQNHVAFAMVKQWVEDARCVSVLKWLNERRLHPMLSRRWCLQVIVHSAHHDRGGVFVLQLSMKSPGHCLRFTLKKHFICNWKKTIASKLLSRKCASACARLQRISRVWTWTDFSHHKER